MRVRTLALLFRRVRQGISNKVRVVELVFFACLLPSLGVWMFSSNPTGSASGFPWVIVGTLLFSARYGSSWGGACALVSGLYLQLPLAAYEGIAAENLHLALAALVMSLVIGDASAAWRSRSQKAEAENHYLRHRLKQFSADYHVLKVSHGLLEEHMVGQRLSLREALQRLKPVLSSGGDGLESGSELMAVFSQFCSIQVAGLYAMSGPRTVDVTPVAIHGDMFDLPVFDPVLRRAISTCEVVSIKLESLADRHHDHCLLAVVPLVDIEGHIHGVLAIKDMHFMAFQQQNLNLLALLGSYVGNQFTRSKGASMSRANWFFSEVDIALRFSCSHGTESTLLSLKFCNHQLSDRVAHVLSESIRSLDASWIVENDERVPVLCLLLPLMSEVQSQAFLRRINTLVKEKYGISLRKILAGVRLMQVESDDTRESCIAFLSEHVGYRTMQTKLRAGVVSQAHSGAA